MIAISSATRGTISEVDESVLSRRYVGNCLDCLFCEDICCSYGCQVDSGERDRILVYATELEARIGILASDWFEAETISDADFPSGGSMRTRTYRNRCVFYDHTDRGCLLHRFAAEKGMSSHQLKPMICSLFPVTWEKGRLFVSSFLDALPCKDRGVSVFEAQKEEVRHYFGDALVSELEKMTVDGTWVTSFPGTTLTWAFEGDSI